MKKQKSICAVLGLLLLIPVALFSQPTSIGPPITTPGLYEFNPCLTSNGRTIIYESSFDANDRPILEISNQKTGTWSKPDEVTGAFHTIVSHSSNGGYFLNSNGNILLFHSKLPKSFGHSDIWIMEKNALGAWTKAQNIGTPINSTQPEIDPSISPDGKYLFFTRISSKEKTPSGYPCGKIFVSENNGKAWTTPIQMPAPINMGCECAGRMLDDNKTFLFASMRNGGVGGYDIYKTIKQTDTTWTEPVPYSFINTAKDDKYVSVPAQGNMIYFTGTDKAGNPEIQKTKISEELQPGKVTLIQGTAKNASNNLIMIPKIIVTNTNTNKSNYYLGAKDGSYTVAIPQDSNIYDMAIMSQEDAFSYNSMLFFPAKNPKFEEKTINAKFSPYKPNHISPLPNIEFLNNSDTLQPYSMMEIARLYTMLHSNITMRIEIGVHTNEIKQDSVFRSGLTVKIVDTLKTVYHSDNTANQAKAIVDCLIKKGIPAERIIPKGYGNKQPLNPPPTDALLNKRVEIKIVHQ